MPTPRDDRNCVPGVDGRAGHRRALALSTWTPDLEEMRDGPRVSPEVALWVYLSPGPGNSMPILTDGTRQGLSSGCRLKSEGEPHTRPKPRLGSPFGGSAAAAFKA